MPLTVLLMFLGSRTSCGLYLRLTLLTLLTNPVLSTHCLLAYCTPVPSGFDDGASCPVIRCCVVTLLASVVSDLLI